MKKIILGLILVLIASMAIASVSAADVAEDEEVDIDAVLYMLDNLKDYGFNVIDEDYEWVNSWSDNGEYNTIPMYAVYRLVEEIYYRSGDIMPMYAVYDLVEELIFY